MSETEPDIPEIGRTLVAFTRAARMVDVDGLVDVWTSLTGPEQGSLAIALATMLGASVDRLAVLTGNPDPWPGMLAFMEGLGE